MWGSCSNLVFHRKLCGQSVISVPLLTEAKSQLLHLVLGLQAPTGLASVSISGTRRVELLESSIRQKFRMFSSEILTEMRSYMNIMEEVQYDKFAVL